MKGDNKQGSLLTLWKKSPKANSPPTTAATPTKPTPKNPALEPSNPTQTQTQTHASTPTPKTQPTSAKLNHKSQTEPEIALQHAAQKERQSKPTTNTAKAEDPNTELPTNNHNTTNTNQTTPTSHSNKRKISDSDDDDANNNKSHEDDNTQPKKKQVTAVATQQNKTPIKPLPKTPTKAPTNNSSYALGVNISHKISTCIGDITRVFEGNKERTAVVNAANRTLLGGGGVDFAIHKAAGPRLLVECEKLPEIAPNVRCRVGDAQITSACELPATIIIHTVGPVYHDGTRNESKLLKSCYRASLECAARSKVNQVAFPAISTGIFGYPLQDATEIAVSTVKDWLTEHPDGPNVIFVCFDRATYQIYQSVLGGKQMKREAVKRTQTWTADHTADKN